MTTATERRGAEVTPGELPHAMRAYNMLGYPVQGYMLRLKHLSLNIAKTIRKHIEVKAGKKKGNPKAPLFILLHNSHIFLTLVFHIHYQTNL